MKCECVRDFSTIKVWGNFNFSEVLHVTGRVARRDKNSSSADLTEWTAHEYDSETLPVYSLSPNTVSQFHKFALYHEKKRKVNIGRALADQVVFDYTF